MQSPYDTIMDLNEGSDIFTIQDLLLKGHRIAFNIDDLDDIYTTLDGIRIETDRRIRMFIKDQIKSKGCLDNSDSIQMSSKTVIKAIDISHDDVKRFLFLHVIPIPNDYKFVIDDKTANKAKSLGINLLENYINK